MLFKRIRPKIVLITPECAFLLSAYQRHWVLQDSFVLEQVVPDLSQETFSILLCPLHWLCLQKGPEEFYLTPQQEAWLSSLAQQPCMVVKVGMVPQALMTESDYSNCILPLPILCGYQVFKGENCRLARWWQNEETDTDRQAFQVFCQRYNPKGRVPDSTWQQKTLDFNGVRFRPSRNKMATLFASAHRRWAVFVVGWGLVGLMTVANALLAIDQIHTHFPARDQAALADVIAYQQWQQQRKVFNGKEVARVMTHLKGQALLCRLAWDGVTYTMWVYLPPSVPLPSIAKTKIKVINAKAGIYKITIDTAERRLP